MESNESAVETIRGILEEGLRSRNYLGMLGRLRTLADAENDDVLKVVAARSYLMLVPRDERSEKWQAEQTLMAYAATPEEALHIRQARRAVEDLMGRVVAEFQLIREANPRASGGSRSEV